VAGSAIPLAIDALLGLVNGSSSFAGVKVFDGPRVSDNDLVNKDRLYIGDSVQDEPAVEGEESAAHSDLISRDEEFAIVCTAEAWTGDVDMKPRRDRAFALKNALEVLVRPTVVGGSQPTLGGVVLWAEVAGGVRVDQKQTPNGAVCSVTFHVNCRARI